MKPTEIKKEESVELETQFILRIPEEPAKLLHDAIQSGFNLKDRLMIKLEQDLRSGEVRFDHWLLHAKVLDLPTIIESLKTIDNKSFYKTADICQIVICKEEPDDPSAEEESPNKAKKKDPNKVDKKYLWPHGVTPPCKNVRKRRFRKTLKKKYVEAPEIEKEVKRLLRIDNDAVSVKYEIINEDDENTKSEQLENSKELGLNETDEDKHDDSFSQDILNKDIRPESEGEGESNLNRSVTNRGLAEHDIFGGEVSSSSSDEEDNRNVRDIQDNSRYSADDSRLSEYSLPARNANTSSRNDKDMITEFDKSMFNSPKDNSKEYNDGDDLQGPSGFYDQEKAHDGHDSDDYDFAGPQMSKDEIKLKILDLRQQCDDLKVQQNQKQIEISSIQNPTLKQRLQETVDNLLSQIVEKEMEIQDYQNMLQSKVANE